MRWRLDSLYCFAYGLINKSYSDEYTATEKWRLCWGLSVRPSLVVLPTFHPCCMIFVYVLFDIFLYNLGMTVLIVMCELLDIHLLFALVICEMSSIPELECT